MSKRRGEIAKVFLNTQALTKGKRFLPKWMVYVSYNNLNLGIKALNN